MKYFDVDKKRKGFTLMEVMITIIIIGILSTLGISTFQSTQKKSRDLNRKAGLTAVTKALEQYMSDKGQYPASSPDGRILWCGTSDAPDSTACSWGDPLTDVTSAGEEKTVYMPSLPKEMVNGQTYFYEAVETDGKVKGYKLYARLENDKDADIPTSGQYEPTCRPGDTTNTKYCNYVITSDTVAQPIGCGIEKSLCLTGGDCCAGTCSTFYTETACSSTSFCGTSAPSGYFTNTTGDACSQGSDCCGGYCCGGICQAGPCCVASGGACTGDGDCCSSACCGGLCQPEGTQLVTYYRDQDGDGYPIQAMTISASCGAPAGYIAARLDGQWDCYDMNSNAYPDSTYCGTVQRGDGSFDYNCNSAVTTCGSTYFTFTGAAFNARGCSLYYCTYYYGGSTTAVGCGDGGNLLIDCKVGSCVSARCSKYDIECVDRVESNGRGDAGTQGCQ